MFLQAGVHSPDFRRVGEGAHDRSEVAFPGDGRQRVRKIDVVNPGEVKELPVVKIFGGGVIAQFPPKKILNEFRGVARSIREGSDEERVGPASAGTRGGEHPQNVEFIGIADEFSEEELPVFKPRGEDRKVVECDCPKDKIAFFPREGGEDGGGFELPHAKPRMVFGKPVVEGPVPENLFKTPEVVEEGDGFRQKQVALSQAQRASNLEDIPAHLPGVRGFIPDAAAD